MTERVLIVGGPHDGQYHAVDPDLKLLKLAIQQPLAVLLLDKPIEPITMTHHVYNRLEIYKFGRLELLVYHDPSIEPGDVLEWFNEGYL